jgi:hypothetical protein
MIKYLLPLIVLAGCQDLNSNSTDKSRYGEGAVAGSPVFVDAFAIVQNRCANCHTSTVHNKWSTYRTEADWKSKESTITAGNPDQSSFITRLKNYPNGDMPVGAGPLPNDELEKLREWIDQL